MAIPNDTWSALFNARPYPKPSFDAPLVDEGSPTHDVSLGPAVLNDSREKLTSRYWLLWQDGNIVKIAGALDETTWGPAVVLFNEALPILQIQLTFDQLGRPVAFYRVGDNQLKLYWFDPNLQQSLTINMATGIDPQAGFDYPQATNYDFTDILLFYQRSEAIYMRRQRDRYEVEIALPAVRRGFDLTSSGLRADNRVQVTYLPVRDPGRFD